jgi:hypothetical protein
MSKTCSKCGEDKPLTEFHKRTASRDGVQGRCKKCQCAARKTWAELHPGRQRTIEFNRKLKSRHGVSGDQFWEMHSDQSGLCGACGDALQPGRKTAVDHSHTTGKVRALLCFHCNVALGHVRESPARLHALLTYLEKHST